jgi:methyl-accepting chemotaxis protein
MRRSISKLLYCSVWYAPLIEVCVQIVLDLTGEILAVNEKYLSIMGYADAKGLVGQHHSMFLEPAERDSEEYRSFWAKLAAGVPHEGEFRRVGYDGTAVHILGTYTPVLDELGKPYKVLKIALDITRQKKIEATLSSMQQAADRSTAVVCRSFYFRVMTQYD